MTQTVSDAQENQDIYDISLDDDEKPRTNGHGSEDGADADGEPPSKKRRVSENPSLPRRKPESPPWKKIIAEGPSSFTQDGIRKSGRTNHIPLELQPPSDKRQTRGAVQKSYSAKSKNGNANGLSPFNTREVQNASVNGSRKPSSSGTTSTQHLAKTPTKPVSPKRSHRKSMPSEQASTPVRTHKKSLIPRDSQPAPAQARPVKARRSGRVGEIHNDGEHGRAQSLKTEDPLGQSPKARLSRIKFRVKPATLPLTHPGLVLPLPRQYPTLKEYLDHGVDIHVDAGGLFHPDEASEYTPEQVAKDAKLILRFEEAAKPGGVLSPQICSAFQPEEPEQVPTQYAHQDHLNRAAIEFRRLMLIEERKHRAAAKRLAEACRDEWYRRQPKTREQLEAEEIKTGQNRYRSLVKTIQATWENVRVEVNRRRILDWEAQEQARVRKALNEAVDMSTQMLQAQRAQLDSETSSDEDEDENDENEENEENRGDSLGDDGSSSDAGPNEERESNMSSTDSEADEEQQQPGAAEDEHLTVEQLREKYASIPALPTGLADENISGTDQSDTSEAENVTGEELRDNFDDSDESVDMDDDMGSSDDDRDSDEEGSNEDDDEAGETSLLGFLAPSELKLAELGEVKPDPNAIDDDIEEGDADEVSMIPDTPQPRSGEESALDTRKPFSESTPANSGILKQPPEVDGNSPDRSSQPTPRTTETKASELDSASSVDLHQNSRQVTQSATPQPGINLKTPVPFLLRGTLREYQHYGLDWLAGLYANNNNGILADEMGLGKTIQTIALLAHLATEHEVWGPHLVVVPTSVMLNWEIEFKKWCPGFKIMTYYGSPEERKRKRLGWRSDDKWNVCITTYQLIIADQQVFKRRQWHFMVLDEAHNIKNFESQRWQVMLKFNTRARLLLTGTPLQNNLTELWSLLYFLMPEERQQEGVSGFASLQEFHDWFKKPSDQILEHGREKMDDEARNIISKLHRVLRPHLLRRLKADVEKQMPAKYEHVEYCRLSKRQRELYDGFLNRDDTRGTLASGNYLSIINCLMQLRKVCNHPDLFVERAIMTSFPMHKSAVADFEIKELLVRRRLLREDPMTKASLEFLNLVPTRHERFSGAITSRSAVLSAQRVLMDMREAQRLRAQNALTNLDPSTAKSNLVYLESASRWGRFEELQHCVYLNALRRQQKPLYGTQLINFLTLGVDLRPHRPRPRRRDRLMTWLENMSPVLDDMVFTLPRRSRELHPFIQKFACVTPPVIARDLTPLTLTPRGVTAVQNNVQGSEIDPFHEARMRLSIQFPDKRLLQYDCGKLQTLDKLLRKLQAGGHRALIFTQMTKVLDILEQFLNIHGHKYLRLDGSTKVEQRQILTDRFNNDNRILAFILSTRSGGLGINLTGADTVIFYDLDWNPAMDKQCQDRCHRIGQTRDVHIYRLVSEHTIEANILRKANQKRMLDDVVIQEGEFTTDYFNKMSVQDVLGDESKLMDGDAAASAAMDRVLGGPNNEQEVQHVLAQAEDKEDVAAAKVAEREIEADAADFDENIVTASATPAGPGTPRDGAPTPLPKGTSGLVDEGMELDEEDELNAWGEAIRSTDDYMLDFMIGQLKDTPVELPKDKSKNKNKKGKDHRSHRAR